MFKKNPEKNDDIELTVEVSVEDEKGECSAEEVSDSMDEPKGLFMSLRDEFAERSAEDRAFDKAVYEEKKRLEAAREEARKKNILRKIKLVDNKLSREELERDELALMKFRAAEQSKLDAARAERSNTIVRENKKPIAIVIIAILMICVALGFIASIKLKQL